MYRETCHGVRCDQGLVPLRSAFYDSGKNAAAALSKKFDKFSPQILSKLEIADKSLKYNHEDRSSLASVYRLLVLPMRLGL